MSAAGFGRGRGRKSVGARTVAAPTKSRVRFVWEKTGLARFLSHLDCIRAIEGALLRAEFPVSYTQGQRPRMKVSFGPPLTLGFTSESELFEVHLDTAPPDDLLEQLNTALPEGFAALSWEIIYTKAPSALESVCAAEYEMTIPELELDSAETSLEKTLAAERIDYTRTTKSGAKELDLRPGVYGARATGADNGTRLNVTLALTDTFYVRPEEFLKVCGLAEHMRSGVARVHRKRLHTETPSYQRTEQTVNGARR